MCSAPVADVVTQIPVQLRNKVVRRALNPAVYFLKPRHTGWAIPYVIGQGDNKVVCWFGSEKIASHLSPYPSIFGAGSRS